MCPARVEAYRTDIRISINGRKIDSDVKAESKRGTTYVPISYIVRALGAKIEWKKPVVSIRTQNAEIICAPGSSIYTINGKQYSIMEQPYLSKGRVFVPLRLVGEQLGCDVAHRSADDDRGRIFFIDITQKASYEPPRVWEDESFEISDNGKWGAKSEMTNGTEGNAAIVYLKDMETKEMKQIYRMKNYSEIHWLSNNKLLIFGRKDMLGGRNRDHLMLYDPDADKFENLTDAKEYRYLPESESVVFRNTVKGENVYGLFDLEQKTTQKIGAKEYLEYINR